MKKTDWYENRTLWRAGKLQLDSCRWRNFLLSHEQSARRVLEAPGVYGVPLFVFWFSDDVWTLLTSQFLVGKLGGVLSSIDLDRLGDVSTANDNDLPPDELKRRAGYIRVGADRKIFWTPAGSVHFLLRNIPGMFPINVSWLSGQAWLNYCRDACVYRVEPVRKEEVRAVDICFAVEIGFIVCKVVKIIFFS